MTWSWKSHHSQRWIGRRLCEHYWLPAAIYTQLLSLICSHGFSFCAEREKQWNLKAVEESKWEINWIGKKREFKEELMFGLSLSCLDIAPTHPKNCFPFSSTYLPESIIKVPNFRSFLRSSFPVYSYLSHMFSYRLLTQLPISHPYDSARLYWHGMQTWVSYHHSFAYSYDVFIWSLIFWDIQDD